MATNQPPQFPVQLEADGRPMDGGLQTKVAENAAELGMSPELGNVRFENGAVRKDFGLVDVGDVPEGRIIALGEHLWTYVDPVTGETSYIPVPYRLFLRNAGIEKRLVIEVFEGGTWNEKVNSGTEEFPDLEAVSVVSYLGDLYIADGKNPIWIWRNTVDKPAQVLDAFTPSAIDQLLGEGKATVTATSSGTIPYEITLNVNITPPAGFTNISRHYFVTEVNGEEVSRAVVRATPGFNGTASVGFNGSLVIGDEVVVRYADLVIEGVLPQSYTLVATTPTLGVQVFWTPDTTNNLPFPTTAPKAYRFSFIPNLINYTQPIPFKLAYVDASGGGPLVTDLVVGTIEPDMNQTVQLYDFTTTIPFGVSGGRLYLYVGDPTIPGTEDIVQILSPKLSWFDGDYTVAATIGPLTYTPFVASGDILQPITTSNFGANNVPLDAPKAKYIGQFGDRIIALWSDGDQQVLGASADGDGLKWDAASGALENTLLTDTRIDPVDPLTFISPLSSQIALLARRRSLMRLYETGNPLLPIGVSHWLDGVGSECPFGFAQVHGGVMFLGADRMVYYATGDRVIAVGAPIQEELYKKFYNGFEYVDAAYDPIFEEFFLGIPADDSNYITIIYVFDHGEFLRTERTIWRKRYESVSRLASVGFIDITSDFDPVLF